jgi:hypothetical protein
MIMQEKDTSTEKSKSRTKSEKHKTNRVVYQSGITSKEHYAAVQIIVFRRRRTHVAAHLLRIHSRPRVPKFSQYPNRCKVSAQ